MISSSLREVRRRQVIHAYTGSTYAHISFEKTHETCYLNAQFSIYYYSVLLYIILYYRT